MYYDGTGVNVNGHLCLYDSVTNQCYTDTLVYDGVGVKPFSEATPLNGACTGGTFLVYDGTGLKPTSYSNATCVAVV